MQKITRIETGDGSHSLHAERFGVDYHSHHGAITETRHVFVQAGFLAKVASKKRIHILGIGFGTGLNALMTLLEAVNHDVEVYYTAVEAYPVDIAQVRTLNYLPRLGAESFASTFEAMHQATATYTTLAPNFHFRRWLHAFEEIEVQDEFDLVYYDAFAPNAQPELWDTPMLQKMYTALSKDGLFVTYCAQGAFKRRLKALGFMVEALPGPPGKREMTRAIKTDSQEV